MLEYLLGSKSKERVLTYLLEKQVMPGKLQGFTILN